MNISDHDTRGATGPMGPPGPRGKLEVTDWLLGIMLASAVSTVVTSAILIGLLHWLGSTLAG